MAAIYMWFNFEEMVLTTTPYPIEVIDSMQLAVNINAAEMGPINSDSHQNSSTVVAITNPLIYISSPLMSEAHKNNSALVGITNPLILITATAPTEAHKNSSDVVSISNPDKLVIVDTPDEKLQLNCDINPSNCSMTHI